MMSPNQNQSVMPKNDKIGTCYENGKAYWLNERLIGVSGIFPTHAKDVPVHAIRFRGV
jgi:hypothetical protein